MMPLLSSRSLLTALPVALALLGLALVLAVTGQLPTSPSPVQAQAPSNVLVSNFDRAAVHSATSTYVNWQTQEYVVATEFTTGSADDAYLLSSIAVKTHGDNAQMGTSTLAKIRAELWSAATTTNNPPDAKVYDLIVPGAAVPGGAQTLTFTAPSNAAALAASTKYYLVVYTTDNFNLQMQMTTSDAEEGAPAAGWSIADGGPYFISARSPAAGNWAQASSSVTTALIQVKGAALTPAVAVSNFDQRVASFASTTRLTYSPYRPYVISIEFQSGTEVVGAGGTPNLYALASIAVKTHAQQEAISASDSANIKAELWSAAATTGSPPGAKLYDLTVPEAAIPAGTSKLTFMAPAHATLDGSTKYFLVVYTTGATNLRLQQTSQDNEASGAVGGWTISDGDSWYKQATTTAEGTWANNAGDPYVGLIQVNAFAQRTPLTTLDLSALTGATSSDGTTFADMTGASALVPDLDAVATDYRSTVGNEVTHARLTPTTASDTSTVKVGLVGGTLDPVTSGSPSAAIPLEVGDNAIAVEVTAADSSTKEYTVTVRRVPAGTVWRATLAPSMYVADSLGCGGTRAGRSGCAFDLTEPTLTVGTTTYAFTQIRDRTNPDTFSVSLDTAPKAELQALKFCAGGNAYDIAASEEAVLENGVDVGWTAGVPVSLSIGTSCAAAAASLDLSALTVATSSDGTTFTDTTGAAAIAPAFAATTTAYRATVGNDVTHVKLTPTVADTSSSVTVNGTAVNSGEASEAIPLEVGDNAITVRVTDADNATRDYTVTVRRVPAGTEWYATLVPAAFASPADFGCGSASECNEQLTDNTFTIGTGTTTASHIKNISDFEDGQFRVDFDINANQGLAGLNFCAGDSAFRIGADPQAVLAPADVRWAEGVPVSVSIGTACVRDAIRGRVSLASNAGETATTTDAALDASRTVAQAFTTGSNPQGYALTGVLVQLASGLSESARNGLKAQIWRDNSGPSSQFFQLLVPAHPIGAGTVTFTAPAGGGFEPAFTKLEPETTYWLVVHGNPINNALKTTVSDNETGETGWDIADTFRYADANPPTGSSTWQTPSDGRSLLLTVTGRELAEKNFFFLPTRIDTIPGDSARLRPQLSEAAPEPGLELTLKPLFGDDLPAGMCVDRVAADADDIGSSAPTTATVLKGRTQNEESALYPLADNGDDYVRGDPECFAVQLGSRIPPWRAGATGAIEIEIKLDRGTIAMGTNPEATSKHTAKVEESAGTLDVPVTVDFLPIDDTTFTIEVLNTGTATEGSDFTLATTTLTFGTTTAKTQNLVVTLTDDDEVEENETIELRIAGRLSVLDDYRADSNGKLATITITSEDTPDTLDLSALTGATSTDGTNFSAMTGAGAIVPAFDAGTTTYRATVGNDITHVRLTPTTATTTASVKVGKAGTTLDPVTSGSPSAAIPLAVGDNAITVEVTDADSATRDYTVTVRRVPPGTEWWATMVPEEYSEGGGGFGCSDDVQCDSQLTDNDFTVGGADNKFYNLVDDNTGGGGGNFDESTNAALQALKFCVGDDAHTIGSSGIPSGDDWGWAARVPVSVSIGTVCALSDNADLSSLTASKATSTTSTFTSLALSPPPPFNPATTTYTAMVTNDITHAKLTPSVSGSADAVTIKVGPQGGTLEVVVSGSASQALALAEGANPFTVEVTAEDGVTTKVYTVTITRESSLPSVSLSASPNPVPEGSAVTITATLSAATTSDVTIPVTITDNSAQPEDHGTLASITISGGSTTGTGTISTNQDSDYADETFTVYLGTPLPTGIVAGSPSSVQITIRDDDTPPTPTVSISAAPNPVAEGSSVTITARLSAATTSPVTVVATVTQRTAGAPGTASWTIPIAANALTGTTTIATMHDDDGNHETFTLSLATPPTGITLGSPSSVTITIRDDEATAPGPVTGLSVGPGYGSLTLSWTAPVGEVTRYEVHYTRSRTVAADADVVPGHYGLYPETEWVMDRRHSGALGLRPTQTINNLEPEFHRVRVRAMNGHGWGPWVEGSGTPMHRKITVSLSATPNPLVEGGDVTVTATLKIGDLPTILQYDFFIPLRVVRESSEAGDHGTTHGVTIRKLQRSASVVIPTHRDGDGDDEFFTVSVGNVTEPVRAHDTEGSVRIRIAEREPPRVSLEASPNPVHEGNTVTVTARLSQAMSTDLTVPVTVTRIDSEHDDHWTLSSITVPRGRTTGTGTIATRVDDDTDDERFTVALGSVPLPATAGSPTSLEVTIADRTEPEPVVPTDTLGPLSISPSPAEEGSTVTLTATLDNTAPSGGITVTFWTYDGRSNSADADDYTLSPSRREQGSWFFHATPGIRIPQGQRTATATLCLVADGTTEGDETFIVHLTVDYPEVQRGYVLPLTIRDSDTTQGACSTTQPASVPEAPPNRAPTVSAAIADATIVSESGIRTVSLSGVFADADHDALSIRAASSDEAVATVSVAADYSSLTVSAQGRGAATIGVTAEDVNGGTVSDTFTVTVKAAPVVASAIADVSGLEAGSTRDVSLSGVFSDADGDALTITATSSDEAKATVSVASGGSRLTVAGVSEGTATMTVTAQDADGNRASDAFEVSVTAPPPQTAPNRAPTVSAAIADATIVSESGIRTVSLSGVFADADHDALSIRAASSDEAVATVSVAADYSSLTVSAQGRGAATIGVTAEDVNGGTVSDTFTVTVKAAPVVASAIADVSGLEAGSTRDVSLSGVFSDADGDALTITATSSDEAKATVSVASGGSRLTVAGVSEGTATMTVTAQDADGNRASDAFEVSVTAPPPPNQAPTVSAAIADATIGNENGSHAVSLSGVFSDADGDALTITAASSDEAKATVSVASDYSSLTVTAQARGTATIWVAASDGKGGTAADSFTVTVKAAPVVASAIADMNRLETGYAQDVSLSGVFSDADGDSLTYSAETSDSAVAEAFLFQGTLTVAALADGSATITVTAEDSDGNTVSDTFDVSVVGPPSPVTNLSCIASTEQVLFQWDAPQWSGAELYAYDYDLTLPDGRSQQVRLRGYPLVREKGAYQVGQEASISVTAVYELADWSEVYSEAVRLSCTVSE